MQFTGRILIGGTVVLDDLDVTLIHHGGPGLQSWSGSFVVPAGQFLSPGRYELELDDGRKGTIVVSQVSFGSSQATVVHFQSSGPLQ
jgi:hypothetical protein